MPLIDNYLLDNYRIDGPNLNLEGLKSVKQSITNGSGIKTFSNLGIKPLFVFVTNQFSALNYKYVMTVTGAKGGFLSPDASATGYNGSDSIYYSASMSIRSVVFGENEVSFNFSCTIYNSYVDVVIYGI